MDNDRDLLLVSIFTFVTVSLWVTFELLKTAKTTTIATTTQQIVVPLSPIIDTDTITVITNNKTY
jgi:hypothetical protein